MAQMTERFIIGLVGPIASGKGEVAKYLKELGFAYQSLSDRLREDLVAIGVPLTRENLQNYGNLLRENYGNRILAERTAQMLEDAEGNICIDSIRNPGELMYLRENLGAIIIGINAREEQRLIWYLQRSRARGEDGATAEDFYKAAQRDLGLGEGDSGQQVKACLELSDFVLYNHGSKEALYEQMSEILASLRSHHPER